MIVLGLRRYLVSAVTALRSIQKCIKYGCVFGTPRGTGLDYLLGTLADVFSGSDRLIQANTVVVPEKQITAVSCQISYMPPFTNHYTVPKFLAYAFVITSLNNPNITEYMYTKYSLCTLHRKNFRCDVTRSSVQLILPFP
jgi:hypothetical protein